MLELELPWHRPVEALASTAALVSGRPSERLARGCGHDGHAHASGDVRWQPPLAGPGAVGGVLRIVSGTDGFIRWA